MKLSPLSQLEVKLVPVSTGGLETLDRIWSRTQLGGMPVISRSEATLWDRYYDTPSFALWLRRGYLRLRSEERADGRDLITYRRARTSPEEGAPPFEVFEITMPFSDLRKITDMLVADTGDLSVPRPGTMGPPEVFVSMGLVELLALRTHRRKMRVELLPGKHLNLKLDVTWFGTERSCYAEVEFELTDPAATEDAARAVLADLVSTFGMEKWAPSYSPKLEIGLRRQESGRRNYPALGL
jgi:hypothetical protein